MNIETPHTGRHHQRTELANKLLLGNPDCALDAALYHHLLNIGMKIEE